MSHYFPVCFRNAGSKLEAFDFAREFADRLASPKYAVQHLESNLIYFETRNEGYSHSFAVKKMLLEGFIRNIFTVKFAYWPTYKLVGVRGNEWPEDIVCMTDINVAFQNATDHDYPFEVWGNSIPFFSDEREDVLALPQQPGEMQDGVDSGYWRRSLLYTNVWEKLQLNSWLEGEVGNFEYFTLSGIHTSEIMEELTRRALIILKQRERNHEF